jgi:hypothetical protein
MSLTKSAGEDIVTLGSEFEGTQRVQRPDVLDVVSRPLRGKGKPKAFAGASYEKIARATPSPAYSLIQ